MVNAIAVTHKVPIDILENSRNEWMQEYKVAQLDKINIIKIIIFIKRTLPIAIRNHWCNGEQEAKNQSIAIWTTPNINATYGIAKKKPKKSKPAK